MKTIQYNYTKFITEDGTEFDLEKDALAHETVLAQIKEIEYLLGGKQHKLVADNKGYYQHMKPNVVIAWEKTIDISKKYFKDYKNIIGARPEDIHPMGVAGRIIDECGTSALNRLWWRFSCIDSDYKEWNQPYYALNKGTGVNIRVNKQK